MQQAQQVNVLAFHSASCMVPQTASRGRFVLSSVFVWTARTGPAPMAARHLQKLRAQEVPSLDVATDDQSGSEEETAGSAPVNPFDLLDAQQVRTVDNASTAYRCICRLCLSTAICAG